MLESYKKLTNSIVGFVNTQQKLSRRTQNAIVPRGEKAAFMAALQWAAAQNLTLDLISEASTLLISGKMLATIEGTLFSRFSEDSLGIFSTSGGKSLDQKQPPHHIEWHHAVYKNKNVRSVLYCHPAAGLSAAQSRALPDPDLLVDGKVLMGNIQIVEPNVEAIQDGAAQAGLLLIPGYGMLATGTDLGEAVTRAVIFNRLYEASRLSAGRS